MNREETTELKKDNKVWKKPRPRSYLAGLAIEVEFGELLYGLIRALKPVKVVETGTFEGFSAVNIAQALKENGVGILWTIDTKDYGAREMFKDYGVTDWLETIIGTSPNALEEIVSKNKVDFVFLDGAHGQSIVSAELEVLHKYLEKGSYIAGHDYSNSYHKGVRLAVEDFNRKYFDCYEKIAITGGDGLYILRKLK